MQGPTGHPRSGHREMSASGEGSGRRPVFRAALDPLKKRWLKTLLYTVVAEVAVPEMSMGSAPPDLSLREERKANASGDQSGPIVLRGRQREEEWTGRTGKWQPLKLKETREVRAWQPGEGMLQGVDGGRGLFPLPLMVHRPLQ